MVKNELRKLGGKAPVTLVNFCSPKLGNRAFADYAFQLRHRFLHFVSKTLFLI
jgi:hypothetical protein